MSANGGERTLENHALAIGQLRGSTHLRAALRDFETNLPSINAGEQHPEAVILPHVHVRISLYVKFQPIRVRPKVANDGVTSIEAFYRVLDELSLAFPKGCRCSWRHWRRGDRHTGR